MVKAVFLDRDGIINVTQVINKKPVAIRAFEQFVFVEGIQKAIDKFIKIGYTIFVVTNQPDISRGKIKIEEVEKINRHILHELPIKKIYMCTHDYYDNCECKKPKAGMLFSAKKEYDVELKSSWIIGDRWSDIEAGKNAGCKTIFVDYGYDEKLKSNPDIIVKNVKEILYDKNFC